MTDVEQEARDEAERVYAEAADVVDGLASSLWRERTDSDGETIYRSVAVWAYSLFVVTFNALPDDVREQIIGGYEAVPESRDEDPTDL